MSTPFEVSIFEFSDYKDFLLKAGLPGGYYNHQSNTLHKWAQRLGYKSPSSLTMVLKGQRLPSFDMIHAISADLGLTAKEREYFQLLIQKEKLERRNKDSKEIRRRIDALANVNANRTSLSLEQFSLISDWYFMVIRNLVGTKDFIEDPEWIRKRLRKKLTIGQIQNAIEVLLKLKLVVRNDKGELEKGTDQIITTMDIPSSAIRMHHHAMMERAQEALNEQEVDARHITSSTLRIAPDNVAEAKKYIQQFIKEFDERFTDKDSNKVYQLNLQLFQHTNE